MVMVAAVVVAAVADDEVAGAGDEAADADACEVAVKLAAVESVDALHAQAHTAPWVKWLAPFDLRAGACGILEGRARSGMAFPVRPAVTLSAELRHR